jgi:YkoY family integral membrane protein
LVGLFSFLTDYSFDSLDVPTFFILIALEAALSLDNAAVLAVVVRRLPASQRRKALFYGLGGAYVFRIVAILGVAFVIESPWLKILGGLYLLYLLADHLRERWRARRRGDAGADDAAGRAVPERRIPGLSLFWSTVLVVEVMDVAFALDQVLAAVGLFVGRGEGDKRLLIILASMVAILALRASAYYMGRVIDWFPQLETFAYLAVGWVGLKLVGVEIVLLVLPGSAFDVPRLAAFGVPFLLLLVPVLWKLAATWARARRRDAGRPGND